MNLLLKKMLKRIIPRKKVLKRIIPRKKVLKRIIPRKKVLKRIIPRKRFRSICLNFLLLIVETRGWLYGMNYPFCQGKKMRKMMMRLR